MSIDKDISVQYRVDIRWLTGRWLEGMPTSHDLARKDMKKVFDNPAVAEAKLIKITTVLNTIKSKTDDPTHQTRP